MTNSSIEKFEKYINELVHQESIFDEDTRTCRICGCTQLNACSGGCYWIEDDLCSQCFKYSGEDIEAIICKF